MLFTLRPYFEFFCLFYAYNIEYLSLIFTFYMYFTCNFWTPQLEEYPRFSIIYFLPYYNFDWD